MTLPGESEVHVGYLDTTSLGGEAVNSADQHLSTGEKSRRDRLHWEADRRDFTIARHLLTQLSQPGTFFEQNLTFAPVYILPRQSPPLADDDSG
jgi:hypothetical protein